MSFLNLKATSFSRISYPLAVDDEYNLVALMNMVPCHTSIHFDRVILITENLFEIWTLGCSNDCHPEYIIL